MKGLIRKKNTLSLPLGEIARDLGNKRVIGTLGLGGEYLSILVFLWIRLKRL